MYDRTVAVRTDAQTLRRVVNNWALLQNVTIQRTQIDPYFEIHGVKNHRVVNKVTPVEWLLAILIGIIVFACSSMTFRLVRPKAVSEIALNVIVGIVLIVCVCAAAAFIYWRQTTIKNILLPVRVSVLPLEGEPAFAVRLSSNSRNKVVADALDHLAGALTTD